MTKPHRFDFLVVGSGIAGLFFALRAAERGSVALVTKKAGSDSATNWAQGGIAAVVGQDDSFEAHVQDTLNAGAGLCREDVVRHVVESGPGMIEALRKYGVEFDRNTDTSSQASEFDLGRRADTRAAGSCITETRPEGRSKTPSSMPSSATRRFTSLKTIARWT